MGENESDFKKYFSGVYVLSKGGAEKYSVEDFNSDIGIEDTDIPVVIPCEEYCYIGFRVSEKHTVSVSEFAFFARSESGSGVLELDFYIVDQMPTSIKNDDGENVDLPSFDDDESRSTVESTLTDGTQSESDTETETEIYEDDIFHPAKQFHASTFSIGEEWDSVLLEFDGSKIVNPGQYIVVRVNNNCYTPNNEDDGEEQASSSISFTFNYLIFYFTDAHKE